VRGDGQLVHRGSLETDGFVVISPRFRKGWGGWAESDGSAPTRARSALVVGGDNVGGENAATMVSLAYSLAAPVLLASLVFIHFFFRFL
jgi:hypothetical protein